MRTASATQITFVMLIGGLALAMSGASCTHDNTTQNRNNGGTTSSGGDSSGGTTSSGGSSETGGTTSSGGSSASGGAQSGGAGGSGGSNSGGSQSGGAGGSDNEGGAGGSDNEGGAGGSDNEGGAGGSDNEGGAGGSDNEGGAGGSGEGGSGGSTPQGCASPIVPSNGSNGGVTDFSDYSTSSGKWGDTSALYGSIYAYPGADGSTMSATVDTTAKTLHATGTVEIGDYAGTGISFEKCATVESFTKVQFTISGSVGDCDLELQIKTFAETPTDGNPPGGCESDCYGFPAYRQVATPSSSSTDVTQSLADFSSWTGNDAKQVLGLQWQVTSPPTLEAACEVDLNITNIKFLSD